MYQKLLLAICVCIALPSLLFGDIVISFGGIADTDSGDGTSPAGVSVLSQTITIDEVITGITLDLNGAVHDWVGDLQITLSNGVDEMTILGLEDGLTFDGTNGQDGNLGSGAFGAASHLSGDPEASPTPLNYSFADGGADLNAIAQATGGGNVIDASTAYAPSAQDSSTANAAVFNSFAGTFGGQSTAGTWTITVVDTFATADTGSISEIVLNFESAAIPEPGIVTIAMLALMGFTARRRR
jgi:hypothetical protein